MVYKKYIKKDGKLYGPYIYQSKRVDGKVVSEYCGPGKKDNKKLILYLMTFLVLGILVLLFFLIRGNLTGNVTLNTNKAKDVEGISQNSLEEISISLKQGEFIPETSKLIFETSSGNYEYPLNDLIDEPSITGKYFVEGEILQGEGKGYGFVDEIITYPEVEFTLISRTRINEENFNDQSVQEEVQEQTIVSDENNSQTEEGVVSQVIENVGNFFLGLSLTGNAVESSSQIQEISGKSSKDNPFIYTLKENETVELVSGSVKADNQVLQDNVLKTSVQGGNFVVEIDYEKLEQEYKKEDIENKEKVFTVPVPLEVIESGNYNVKLIYPLEESEEELNVDLEIIESDQENFETNKQETNTSSNESLLISLNSSIPELTPQEKEILISEFGNFSVQTVKSQLFNGRYIIGYELGNYNIEYSYDSSLNQEMLNSQIEADKIKWLKDISNSLKLKNNLPIQVNQFDSEFSIF